jgi:Ni,Fe-hydrogenase I cytochrome b subunit
MKSSVSLGTSLKPFLNFIRKFHFTFSFVIIAAILAYCVLSLNTILDDSSNTNGYTSSLTVTSFDQTTVNELQKLSASSAVTSAPALPSGRINPFTE